MDKFKIPKFKFPNVDPLEWDSDISEKKMIKSAQFSAPAEDVMLTIAMKNFWVYQYDRSKKK